MERVGLGGPVSGIWTSGARRGIGWHFRSGRRPSSARTPPSRPGTWSGRRPRWRSRRSRARWPMRAGRPMTYGEIGYPNGVIKAALAISGGLASVVVVFWGKAGWKVGPGGKAVPASAPRGYDWAGDAHGPYMTPWYAMWAQRYMHEFGVTSEDLAEVAVTHRYHATLKPDSVMGSRGPHT